MRFAGNTSNVGSWIQAGKAGAQGAADFFKVARANAPDYGGLANANLKARSSERIAITKAESQVAQAGINATARVKGAEIEADLVKDKAERKAKATRMTGIIGGLGAIAGGAFMGYQNKQDEKRQAERDALDERRHQDRMSILREQAGRESTYTPTMYTPEPYDPNKNYGEGGSDNSDLTDTQINPEEVTSDGGTSLKLAPSGSTAKPSSPVSVTPGNYDGTFESVVSIARAKGAKYPELVGAQWQLESGSGKFTSGKNNLFGQKGGGSTKTTTEYVNGKPVKVKDSFIDEASPEASIGRLVDWWHKDYKNFKGVNNASSLQGAAQMLKDQNYATDPNYVGKLNRILQERGVL